MHDDGGTGHRRLVLSEPVVPVLRVGLGRHRAACAGQTALRALQRPHRRGIGMSDLAKLRIWNDPAIRDALSWYLEVAENRRPAKFRIAATRGTQFDLAASSEAVLWTELDRLTPIFLQRWRAIRAGAPLPPAAQGPSLLELTRELAYRMFAHCNFCPWDCRVD